MAPKKRGSNDEEAMQKIEDCANLRFEGKSSVTGMVSSSSGGIKGELNEPPTRLNLFLHRLQFSSEETKVLQKTAGIHQAREQYFVRRIGEGPSILLFVQGRGWTGGGRRYI